MKILYHHRTASKDGQAVHIEEMIEALRDQGHEVRIVCPAQPDHGAMGAEVGWVGKLRAALPRSIYELLELAYTLVAYRKLAHAAREFKPDIIYERYNLYMLAGLLLKRRLGLPLLLEVNAPLAQERQRYGGLSLPRLAHWAERTTWCGADVVLPVTHVLAQSVRACGVPVSRISVIPNGINQAHFAETPSPEDAKAAIGSTGDFLLGFTGFVRNWHGVDRVLRWLAGPNAPPNAKVLVVGDGPARAELEQLAVQLGIAHRLRFTGFVDRRQVPALTAAFDVALQPAVVPYASPLKLFEYLALGKAIVAPDEPNLREVLVDGVNALLFNATQSAAFEGALSKLCADAALRATLAQGARETIAASGLTWHHNAKRVVQLGLDLCARA